MNDVYQGIEVEHRQEQGVHHPFVLFFSFLHLPLRPNSFIKLLNLYNYEKSKFLC